MRQPVTIYTLRNGNPWVMFGKHYGGDTPYADTGRTFIEQIAMHGSADESPAFHRGRSADRCDDGDVRPDGEGGRRDDDRPRPALTISTSFADHG